MQTFAYAPVPAFPMPLPDGAPPLPEREEMGLRLRRGVKPLPEKGPPGQ